MKLPEPPLLVITDRRQAKLPLLTIIEAALAAGCRWISLRENDLTAPEQAAFARQLLPAARRAGACMTLHGEPGLAVECQLDGVHLPADGNPVSARCVLGPSKLIGMSIHSVAEARVVDPTILDYAIVGPAFETESKPGYGPALGGEALGNIAHACAVPVLAVGGIDPMRASEVLGFGIAGLAVMGGVMRAAHPGAEVKALLSAFSDSKGMGTCEAPAHCK
jgi:thiamine-phosphate pyrophosphorylase